ncbi:hypothetical protein KK467_29515, partial [Klebsiella pneumoniae]|uniref:hypothetical protein n=1 Tax=Klebsiella pneumoniae TaxID=573 RepID=UPI001BE0A8A2
KCSADDISCWQEKLKDYLEEYPFISMDDQNPNDIEVHYSFKDNDPRYSNFTNFLKASKDKGGVTSSQAAAANLFTE